MANIKSSAKRVLVSQAQNARNRAGRSYLKTMLKKFDAAAAGSDAAVTAAAYKTAVSAVDRAAARGLIHKNNAARKKSQLARKLGAAV